MSESICLRPLQEFYLGDGPRAKPDTFLHFFGTQFVPPTRLVRVRQSGERHRGRDQMTNFLEDLTSHRRNKRIADTSNIDQVLAAIIADDERVDCVRARDIPTGADTLPELHVIFKPLACA